VGTSAVTFQLSSDRGIWERLKDILGVNSRIGDVIVTQNENNPLFTLAISDKIAELVYVASIMASSKKDFFPLGISIGVIEHS
jgi:hypothetical protein